MLQGLKFEHLQGNIISKDNIQPSKLGIAHPPAYLHLRALMSKDGSENLLLHERIHARTSWRKAIYLSGSQAQPAFAETLGRSLSLTLSNLLKMPYNQYPAIIAFEWVYELFDRSLNFHADSI